MKGDLVMVELLHRTYLQGGIMGEVNDSAKQVLGRIAEVWQIDTGRVRWSTKERPDALAFENYIVDRIRANIGARNAIDAL